METSITTVFLFILFFPLFFSFGGGILMCDNDENENDLNSSSFFWALAFSFPILSLSLTSESFQFISMFESEDIP